MGGGGRHTPGLLLDLAISARDSSEGFLNRDSKLVSNNYCIVVIQVQLTAFHGTDPNYTSHDASNDK